MNGPDLAAIFALPFMARSLAMLLVLALASGTVGELMHLRRLEFASDGLTHAVFPGLVLGFLVAGEPGLLPGALVAAVLAAVVLSLAARRGSGDETVVAIVLTAFFSLGVVLVSTQRHYTGQLTEMLFGRLLTITDAQLVVSSILVALAIAAVACTWRQQVYRAFDAAGARAAGIRTLGLDLVLNAAIALVVVAAAAAVGVLLVLAVLIVPAASARLVTNRIGPAVVVATLVAALAGVLGLVIAWQLSVGSGITAAPGATVALTMIGLYLIALAAYGIRRLLGAAGARRARPAPGPGIAADAGEPREALR